MEFSRELEDKINGINQMLEQFLPVQEGRQERLIEAMNYSVAAGGKRIRPLILQESYRLCGGMDEARIQPFMAALECIHTYSLVHDDLPAMDNDDYRRGKHTTHKKFGEDFGILAGDGLLNYAYELMLSAITNWGSAAAGDGLSAGQTDSMLLRGVKAASVIAAKAGIYGMVGGQSLDVWLTDRTMDAGQLDFIFNLKTGALIEAAFMAGAILAGADEVTVKKLEKAGNCVGVAFQIKDDILDVTSTQEVLGKPVFSDEKNNKTTYVTLYGMERANADVTRMSKEAVRLIRESGNNEFLVQLVYKLISREK